MNSRELAFSTLGLAPFASTEEIKAQYRRLALKCHPDRVDASMKRAAHDRFALISAAYEFLMGNYTGIESNPVLYAPTSFTDPYQLFRESFGEVSFQHPITIPYRPSIAGYLTQEAASVTDEPMQQEDDLDEDDALDIKIDLHKRHYEEIAPPSSPITTATFDYDAPSPKRPKVEQIAPPPFVIRRSIKRDTWSVEGVSDPDCKRRRMEVCA